MASHYTSRYQLCQWAAEDAFLRAEFNGDNQKVEGALGKLADRTTEVEGQVARQLPPLQKSVYNLLLQRYYDGKETGFKQALFFDGLLDESCIAATEPGAGYDSVVKRIKVYPQGMAAYSTTYAVAVGDYTIPYQDGDKCGWAGSNGNNPADSTLTFTGFGRLNRVTLRMSHSDVQQVSNSIGATVSILKGNTVLAVSNTVSVNSLYHADYQFVFAGGVFLAPGEYTIRVSRLGERYMLRTAYVSRESRKFGGVYDITPTHCTTGAATSIATDLGVTHNGARAWVRHVGGAVGLALRSGDGAFVDMTPIGTRQTVNLQGVPCTESSFGLTAAAASSLVTARLMLNTEGTGCEVCDYGIVFL